jgi:hypothetical protein
MSSRFLEAAAGLSETSVSAGATAPVANSEEIDIDDVDEEDDLVEDFVDDGRAAGQGSGQDCSESAAAAGDARQELAAEESMFAPVELHNYNPHGAAAEIAETGDSGALPEALSNALNRQ